MTATVRAGFDAAGWDRLGPAGSPQRSTPWLRAMADRLPGAVHTVRLGDRVGFVGAVVRDPAAYEAYNPAAILLRDPPVFADPPGRRAGLAALGAGPAAVLPALVLVAPGYDGDPTGPAAADPGAVADCLAAAGAWAARADLAGVHVLYAGPGSVVAAAAVPLGGVRYPLTERWRLPVRWADWPGYLAGLPRRHRKEVGRELRRAAEAGLVPGRVDLDREAAAVLAARCRLLRRYGQPVDPAAEERRLAGLRAAFGPGVTAYGAYRGGELVACALCVRAGRTVQVVHTGLAADGLPYAHFLAAFYAVAQHVDRSEVDSVDYGIGHGAGKAVRGCRPEPLHGVAIGVAAGSGAVLAAAAALLRGDG